MTEQQKKQLVGAAALIVSALILFPLLLDGSGYRERHLQARIPEPPALPAPVNIEPVVPVPEPSATQPASAEPAVISVPVPEIAAAVDASRPQVSAREEVPVLDEQQVPVAWTLQLASFKDEANARSLRTELVKAGYKVYIRHGPDLVRVFVGPDLQRSRLEALQAQLKADYALDGMIVRFTTQ